VSQGLTQSELAEKLFVTNKTISKWENAKAEPSLKTLLELTKIFNVTLDELVPLNKDNNKKIYKIAITGGPCSGKIYRNELDSKRIHKAWVYGYVCF